MAQSSPWHRWYGLERWRKRQRAQLLREPLCKFCLERGVVIPATTADHVEPHRGDFNKFMLGALQSLCTTCHSSAKQQMERRGYVTDIGPDGWPTDPRHPNHPNHS
jgi:5-methylcytosine-specific restriction protein A